MNQLGMAFSEIAICVNGNMQYWKVLTQDSGHHSQTTFLEFNSTQLFKSWHIDQEWDHQIILIKWLYRNIQKGHFRENSETGCPRMYDTCYTWHVEYKKKIQRFSVKFK